MTNQIETDCFLNDLERVVQVRSEVAVALNKIADTIDKAEIAGDTTSGKLSLERDIEDIRVASKNLRSGVFRLLVLGDMKRGKSTLLNALLGENLLPSDVNPCTAVLTVLRYEPEKKVTVYFNDGKWTISAEKDINAAFAQLSRSAAQYGASYNQVTDQITEKLTGEKVKVNTATTTEEDNSPTWAKWAMGLLSLSRGNLAGMAMAGAGFDWKNILLNYFTVIGVGGIITAVTGIFLGPIGFALLGLGVGFFQADQARQELVKTAKKELVKYLPQVAQEQSHTVHQAVKECFDSYEIEVSKRINDDITARKSELDNLLKQKETREINRDSELKRLKKLDEDVFAQLQTVESAYSNLLAYYS